MLGQGKIRLTPSAMASLYSCLTAMKDEQVHKPWPEKGIVELRRSRNEGLGQGEGNLG